MFQANRLVFYYAVTPIHMGAGSAIGAIDNPIQREVHTKHPTFAGSGLKGSLRHHLNRAWPRTDGNKSNPLIARIFGPETNASDYAGSLSLSDAQLVALPVRSLKGAYVYATCPLALARAKRFAALADIAATWAVPSVPEGHAQVVTDTVLAKESLVLEAFEFSAPQVTARPSRNGSRVMFSSNRMTISRKSSGPISSSSTIRTSHTSPPRHGGGTPCAYR